ncbi:MAG TPA: hypothetical protein VNO30_06775 [Kofleriaceae bacterium]|nr:hypothetical protein [Kofleriaceae bacterium]
MQQEHEQQSQAQHDEALQQTAGPDPEAAVEQQPAVQAAPPAASFTELTGQVEVDGPQAAVAKAKADEEAKDQPLANTDAMIEQLAHGMVDKELDENDERFLRANGYEAMPVIRGVHEFVMRTFVPTQGGKPPIVAFRGTVPTKVQTVIADLDPSGIGMYQFNPNRALIEGQMQAAAAHGKIISSGHSLGGALAQIAAATFPDLTGRIVTFQAPGVSREMAQRLVAHNEQHPDEAIDSTHHRVKNDLVPMGGQALTPGTIHNHEMVGGSMLGRNPLAAHLVLPLAQEEMAKGNDVPVHNDQGVRETGTVSTEEDNAEKSQLIEMARTGLGHLVYGTGALIHGIGDAVSSVFRH